MGTATDRTLVGIVVSKMAERNFGFLTPSSGPRVGEEIFFHKSACSDWDSLIPGDRVTYIEAPTEKGPRALKVQKVQ